MLNVCVWIITLDLNDPWQDCICMSSLLVSRATPTVWRTQLCAFQHLSRSQKLTPLSREARLHGELQSDDSSDHTCGGRQTRSGCDRRICAFNAHSNPFLLTTTGTTKKSGQEIRQRNRVSRKWVSGPPASGRGSLGWPYVESRAW